MQRGRCLFRIFKLDRRRIVLLGGFNSRLFLTADKVAHQVQSHGDRLLLADAHPLAELHSEFVFREIGGLDMVAKFVLQKGVRPELV